MAGFARPFPFQDVDARHKGGHDEVFAKFVMTGLVPVIHDLHTSRMTGFVYLMTNRLNGTLYCGVTNDIARRTHEHREGRIPGFTRRYGLNRLVWFEEHFSIADAIQRETSIKRWPRAYKVRLIHENNPAWNDLYETLA